MNLLIISDFQIYPCNSGASIAQLGVIEPLSQKCNISLLIPKQFTPPEKELNELKELIPNVKIYTFEKSLNVSNYIQVLKGLNRSFEFAKRIIKKALINNRGELAPCLDSELGNLYSYLYPAHSKESVDKISEIIENDKIDIVQLEFDSNLNLVALLPKKVKKVFIEHECQFYRIYSHINVKHIQTKFANYIYNLVKTIELSFLEQFDTVITFNENETLVLNTELQARSQNIKVVSAPFPILDRNFVRLARDQFCQPNKLVFVGSELHFPNKDGIEWFLEEAALQIFREFGLRLYVVSGWSHKTMRKYKNHPSQVTFTGYLDNLCSFTRNSICIAPMRIGGGLRAKILSAMAEGIPVISTTHSLSGISAKHMESVMIANDTTSFCTAVEYLLSDLDRTFNLCKNAQDLMYERYSQSYASEKRFSIYEDILSGSSGV